MKTAIFLLLAVGLFQMCCYGQAAESPALSAPPPSPPARPLNSLEDMWKAQRETARHSKWNICVDVPMVAMEEAKALNLIPDLQSGEQAKVDAAWARIQAMIKTKEAMLLGWPMVQAVDGGRSVSESIIEKRYATEYEAPLPPKEEKMAAAIPDKPVVEDALPTAFETRNVGVTLEAEATVLDDGKRVHLNLVSQRVELVEMEKNESRMKEGKVVVQEFQPLFASSKSTEAFTVFNQKYQLIGIHVLTKPAGFIELHLVRVTWAEAK